MKKQDIINQVAQRTGVEKYAICVVIDETINVIKESLCEGIPIYIRGLFTLRLVKRAAKKGRNVTKGIPVEIQEHYAPHAKFSKKIKKEIEKRPIK